MIERVDSDLSLSVQSSLLGVSRSSLYYLPCPPSPEEVLIRHRIDEIYTQYPFYGSRRMKEALKREGTFINRKRVRNYMREMGISAIYPGPNLSKRNIDHKIYPYLLKGLTLEHPNHVWGIDITYIRLEAGWMYLVAIIDWFSRYVVSWNMDQTLEMPFVIEALENALCVGSPVILNSDQGSHFTSPQYTDMLEKRGIRISMDGKNRAIDNIFTERLWRSVKYEEVYLNSYRSPREAWAGLRRYFKFYNEERPHQSLDYRTPLEVYSGAGQVRHSLPLEPDYNVEAA